MAHIQFIRAVFVAAATALLVTHFILLILRIDRISMITFWQLSIPAFVAYGLALLYFGTMGMVLSARFHYYSRAWRYFALAIIAGGSLWSQIALAGKFETDFSLTHWQALLPFLVAVVIGAVIYIIALKWEKRDFSKKYRVYLKERPRKPNK